VKKNPIELSLDKDDGDDFFSSPKGGADNSEESNVPRTPQSSTGTKTLNRKPSVAGPSSTGRGSAGNAFRRRSTGGGRPINVGPAATASDASAPTSQPTSPNGGRESSRNETLMLLVDKYIKDYVKDSPFATKEDLQALEERQKDSLMKDVRLEISKLENAVSRAVRPGQVNRSASRGGSVMIPNETFQKFEGESSDQSSPGMSSGSKMSRLSCVVTTAAQLDVLKSKRSQFVRNSMQLPLGTGLLSEPVGAQKKKVSKNLLTPFDDGSKRLSVMNEEDDQASNAPSPRASESVPIPKVSVRASSPHSSRETSEGGDCPQIDVDEPLVRSTIMPRLTLRVSDNSYLVRQGGGAGGPVSTEDLAELEEKMYLKINQILDEIQHRHEEIIEDVHTLALREMGGDSSGNVMAHVEARVSEVIDLSTKCQLQMTDQGILVMEKLKASKIALDTLERAIDNQKRFITEVARNNEDKPSRLDLLTLGKQMTHYALSSNVDAEVKVIREQLDWLTGRLEIKLGTLPVGENAGGTMNKALQTQVENLAMTSFCMSRILAGYSPGGNVQAKTINQRNREAEQVLTLSEGILHWICNRKDIKQHDQLVLKALCFSGVEAPSTSVKKSVYCTGQTPLDRGRTSMAPNNRKTVTTKKSTFQDRFSRMPSGLFPMGLLKGASFSINLDTHHSEPPPQIRNSEMGGGINLMPHVTSPSRNANTDERDIKVIQAISSQLNPSVSQNLNLIEEDNAADDVDG